MLSVGCMCYCLNIVVEILIVFGVLSEDFRYVSLSYYIHTSIDFKLLTWPILGLLAIIIMFFRIYSLSLTTGF